MVNELIILSILSIDSEEDRIFAEKLYNKYYALIKTTIFKILKRNDIGIDDLVHDVFVKLIDKIPMLYSFDEAVLTSYISVVSKNATINHIKRRDIKSDLSFLGEDDFMESIVDDNKMPDELFILKEEQENLYKVLKQLPEKQKLILQFKYFFEMSDKEIAKIFDISSDSVKVYISRARKMAYKLFKESGFDYNEPK